MSDHVEEINATCEAKNGEGRAPDISQRNNVARELFGLESASIQAEYATKAKERLEEEIAEYNSDRDGQPSDDPESQER